MDRVEVCRSIAAVDTLFRFIVINKFASKVRSVRFGSSFFIRAGMTNFNVIEVIDSGYYKAEILSCHPLTCERTIREIHFLKNSIEGVIISLRFDFTIRKKEKKKKRIQETARHSD